MRTAFLVLTGALLAAAEPATLSELGGHFVAYEPVYFALDPAYGERQVNAKFQLSFACRVVGKDSVQEAGPDGLYAAYSQTSFWDLETESMPFLDSSYRPETWWHVSLPALASAEALALEPGIGHESNGLSGDASRSLNHVFVRALGQWRHGDLIISANPRARIYTEKDDNPDIAEYRGHVDLSGSVRKDGSWGLAATGRIGDDWDKGSLMLELTHPATSWTGGWMHGYLYIQSFIGWSESLLGYDQRTDQPRVLVGFSLTR